MIFGILFGLAALGVAKEDPARGEKLREAVLTLQAIIMRLVQMIMALTPYGILALSPGGRGLGRPGPLELVEFVGASYVAIAIMLAIHGILLRLAGVNVRCYFKTVWPVLTFAFTSQLRRHYSLNVETQVDGLKVPEPIANLSATFGATIG